MRPASFDYLVPTSLDEALDDLRRFGAGARVLAGGQSLMPHIIRRDVRPATLVDLGSIPQLRGIEARGDVMWVGAMEPMVAIEQSPLLAGSLPLLVDAVGQIAHLPIRTRGTIGGSVANADPAAELPLVMATLQARATVAAAGTTRNVAVADLFDGPFSTTVGTAELIVGFEIPVAPGPWAFHEVSRRQNDRPLALAAAVDLARGGTRVGVGPTTVPGQVVVVPGPMPGDLREVASTIVDELELFDEPHCPPDVRRACVLASIQGCLEQLIARR